MTRAALLARVSTERQATEEHHSLPVQLDTMHRLAERMGWTVVATYEIPGESAFTDEIEKRPEFDAAIRAGERGEYEILVVYDFSRFARNQYLAHATLRRLKKAGVELYGSNGFNYSADDDMAGMEAIFAQRASRDHARRVRDAIQKRFELGLPTGDIPFGYKASEKPAALPPTVVEDEAGAIVWAYTAFVSRGSYLDITREFNRRGLRPRSKSRRIGNTGIRRPPNVQFTVTGIQRILENPFYVGYVQHKGKSKRGLHEPIVSDDLFAQVQDRKRKSSRAPRSTGLLSGLAVCYHCEHGIWCEKSGSGYRYYGERTRGQTEDCVAVGHRWRDTAIHEIVGRTIEHLGQLTLDMKWVRARDIAARHTPPATRQSARLDLEERKRRLTNAYLQGGLPDGEYTAAMQGIADQLAGLPPDIDRVEFAGKRITKMAEVWSVATEGERRELLRELLRSVRIDLLDRQIYYEPWGDYMSLFATVREHFGVITPGRSRALLARNFYTLGDLGLAA